MKTTMTVKGTHCESCKALIEDVVKEQQGVVSANVDFKTGKTVIEHTGKLDKQKLKNEIESIGDYKVETVG